MRSKPPGLAEYFDILDRFLAHCRQHLRDEDFEILRRRITGTPPGEEVYGPWTPLDFIRYYWRKLSPAERRAFLREHRRHRRPQEVL